MHYFGQEAISRPTRRSARALVLLSFVVWIVSVYKLPIEDFAISGVALTGTDTAFAALRWVVLLFLLADHTMNCCSDVLAYKAWNVRDKLTATAGFGSDTGLMNKLDAVIQTVKEKMSSTSSDEREIALERLNEIRTELWRLNNFAAWYLGAWILIPTLCCIVALFSGVQPPS